MTQDLVIDPLPEAPKKRLKRKYTRRAVREEVKPKRQTANLAGVEIDARIAQAIRDRAEAMVNVSKLVYWQDRLARIEQEINSLIGFQQRLSGKGQIDRVDIHGQTSDGRFTPPLASVPPYSHLTPPTTYGGHMADISGVSSIPTKVANPKPSHGNVAEIVGGEGGFS